MITVIVFDDHSIVHLGVKQLFDQSEEFNVVSTAKALPDFKEKLSNQTFDLALVDLNVGKINTLDHFNEIKTIAPKTKFCAFSMYDSIDLVNRAKSVGLNGFLVKSDSIDEITFGLRQIMNGSFYVSQNITNKMWNDGNEGKTISMSQFDIKNVLSKRELDVANLYAEGKSSDYIAENLHISVLTLKQHRRNIYKKLNVNSISQLAVLLLNRDQ